MRPVKKNAKLNSLAIAVIAALVGASFLASYAFGEKPEAAVAVVHDGDGGQTQIALDGTQDGEHVIATSQGTNVLLVEDGSIRVVDADCANHDCIDQGAIDATNQQIVCLPHKLWIEVVVSGSDDGTESYDAVGR